MALDVPGPRDEPRPAFIEPWELEDRLGYRWRRRELLIEALTHVSWGRSRGLPINERLEFLGDSVLDLAVADRLMARHPDRQEGFMAQRREELVCEATLARHAVRLHVDRALMTGPSPMARQSPRVLADAMEAVVGALWLDCDRHLPRVASILRDWGLLG